MRNRNWSRLSIIAVMLFGIVIAFRVDGQEDSVAEAKRLNDQVEALFGAGRYQEAIPLAQSALAIRERVLGAAHPETATSLNNLAELYRGTGAYAKAEPLYQRALAIREKVRGAEHPETATSLNDLARLYRGTGAYAKAEPLYQRALAIREKVLGAEHPDTAASLNNLALLYQLTGAYAKAEPLYQRALAIDEAVLGAEHPGTAVGLSNLAGLYRDTGAYAKAEPLLQRALAIREKVLGAEHPNTALILNNLAGLYRGTGAYAKAEPLLQRSLAINEKVLGAEHPDTAGGLNNLAALYRDTGTYAKAEPLYQRALAIDEKVLGAEHPSTALILNNLARLYWDTGAYAKAEPLLQRALAIREKVLGAEHPDTAVSLNNLAELYFATRTYAKAEPLYQRALAIREKLLGAEHPDTAGSLNTLAALYFATGAYEQAERLNERVQTIDEQNALRFLFSGSESRKKQYIRQRVGRVSANISLSLINPTASSTALGLIAVLQYKSRALDVMSDSLARLRRSLAQTDRTLLDQLAANAQEFSNLTYQGPGRLSTEAYRERLDTLTQQQDTLQAQLASRSAAFGKTLVPITLNTVRQALPNDTSLVEWFRYQPFDPKVAPSAQRSTQPRYVAYVLKHTGEPVAINIGEARPIEDLIVKFRRALIDPTSGSRGASRVGAPRVEFKRLAAELSEILIEPLRPYLSQSERLLISPDGALNLVPFAALLDESGDYLAQHFEISYLTSGRDLLRIADDPPAYNDSVVLAAPNYGRGRNAPQIDEALPQSVRSAELDRSGLIFNSLPGTTGEAKVLQTLLRLRPDQTLTGDRATEAQLRALHGPRILHLATHGFFLKDEDLPAAFSNSVGWDDQAALPLRENPLLRAGLALAGANERRSGDADDGILTAAEVAQLDLVGAQLVVLSACETALGTVDAGEGVYGLRRALVLAGAQSQLVSLWKVDDAATQSLMTEYYQRLLDGEGRAAALRSVQLSMLADPARQHPYYWAAFIPIGNWTPLGGQPVSK